MTHGDMLARVRLALGRTTRLPQPPVPPDLPEPVVRLVHTNLGLAELWMKRAAEMKVDVTSATPDDLLPSLVTFLRDRRLQRIMFPASKLLDSLGVAAALEQGGFDARRWTDMTLDQAYDFDCGLTDAAYAVAETGSVVIRPGPGHGRAISLVPVHHVVILEPANFLPDLLDLFERLETDGLPGSGCVLITGPSKTADIEANLVEGVHGPRVVKAFVLR